MHRKSFNSFIILDNRIETLLLQFLPIATEFVFIIRVKHE